MRTRELTQKQVSSVPCPTCGVAAGHGCVLNTGGPRVEPHPDRKFSAAAAIERKRASRRPLVPKV
ncbi:MAG: zinc finger domain-containing protein [Candidatus Acidiferrales bacterium]